MIILSIRHPHLLHVRPCDLCRELIPAGARSARVVYAPNARIGHGAHTARYHNRCWSAAENDIKAAQGRLEPWSWGQRFEDFMDGAAGDLCRNCKRKYLGGGPIGTRIGGLGPMGAH